MKKDACLLICVFCLAGLILAQDRQASEKGSQLPPEVAVGQAPKIMGYDVAPACTDRDKMDLAQKGYPTNTSLGYKGVVMANFSSADAADEIMVDFGSLGLWYYNDGSWSHESGVDPEGMIAVTCVDISDDELVVDFGSLGLWYWDLGWWNQLSAVNPTGMFAVDDDFDERDEIHVDFGSLGLWRYDRDDSSWTPLSTLDPYCGLQMDYATYGYQEGCWCFMTHGVWSIWDFSGPYYVQLTGTVTGADDHASAQFTATSGAEDLVMDFGSLGIWLFREGGSGWVQISTMSPNRVKEVKFVGGQDYELLAEDNLGGLYWGNWNGSGMTWTLITNTTIGPGWCETFDRDGTDSGDEEVLIPLNSGGCLIYNYSAGESLSTFISGTGWFINFMVKGDYYGRGYDSTMAFVFSSSSDSPGLWLWDQAAGWLKISNYIPDGLY